MGDCGGGHVVSIVLSDSGAKLLENPAFLRICLTRRKRLRETRFLIVLMLGTLVGLT